MSKLKISEFFNPDQHLVFHQDKEGSMIGGGYQVNNILYQNKMPLFVSLGGEHQDPLNGMRGGNHHNHDHNGGDNGENKHFIPEKFSDLFRDLAVPAGLFVMPSLFRAKNYMNAIPDEDVHHRDRDREQEVDSDSDASEHEYTKPVPNDVFDTLLSMVTPSERIQHDVKTRRRRHNNNETENKSAIRGKSKKRQNKTRRGKHDEF